MAWAAAPFLFLVALALFFATYNTVTMIVHHSKQGFHEVDMKDDDRCDCSSKFLDPVIRRPQSVKNSMNRPFHVTLTATDAPYAKWQFRIMYYWYKNFKDEPGSEMGGFTRILHSGKPDNLMDEIPSFVVDPLPDGADHGYIVLNRPWAFVQWLKKATIKEGYIFMAEPDHIIVKPLPNLAWDDYPAGFPFFYITPIQHKDITTKYYPEDRGPVTDIDPIGNSLVNIKKSLLEDIAPTWMNISIKLKEDPTSDKAFGWVLEMYGHAIASALHGVQHILRKDFMTQPPWDLEVGKKYMIHYTYGCDYNMKGELKYGKFGEWRFDKRSYIQGAPPKNLTLPPPGVPKSGVTLVKMVNEATTTIPDWEEGQN